MGLQFFLRDAWFFLGSGVFWAAGVELGLLRVGVCFVRLVHEVGAAGWGGGGVVSNPPGPQTQPAPGNPDGRRTLDLLPQ